MKTTRASIVLVGILYIWSAFSLSVVEARIPKIEPPPLWIFNGQRDECGYLLDGDEWMVREEGRVWMEDQDSILKDLSRRNWSNITVKRIEEEIDPETSLSGIEAAFAALFERVFKQIRVSGQRIDATQGPWTVAITITDPIELEFFDSGLPDDVRSYSAIFRHANLKVNPKEIGPQRVPSMPGSTLLKAYFPNETWFLEGGFWYKTESTMQSVADYYSRKADFHFSMSPWLGYGMSADGRSSIWIASSAQGETFYCILENGPEFWDDGEWDW